MLTLVDKTIRRERVGGTDETWRDTKYFCLNTELRRVEGIFTLLFLTMGMDDQ